MTGPSSLPSSSHNVWAYAWSLSCHSVPVIRVIVVRSSARPQHLIYWRVDGSMSSLCAVSTCASPSICSLVPKHTMRSQSQCFVTTSARPAASLIMFEPGGVRVLLWSTFWVALPPLTRPRSGVDWRGSIISIFWECDGERFPAIWTVFLVPCYFLKQRVWGSQAETLFFFPCTTSSIF